MILYNMRHRGPYEYDKFVLNILQIANSINLTEINELEDNKEKLDSLKAIQNNIDTIYNKIISTDNKKGISELIYERSYFFNGGK